MHSLFAAILRGPILAVSLIALSSPVFLAQAQRMHSPVLTDPSATPREIYGASKLSSTLDGLSVRIPKSTRILVGVRSAPLFASVSNLPAFAGSESEAFHILRRDNLILVLGSDPSGVLYGCMELAQRLEALHAWPTQLDVLDKPALRIRATNLFWMKTGGNYDWPVTPVNFPWFFDRALMTHYLDFLAENRFNTIVFWNGHPFPYFLPLARYPEARMLSDADLARNEDYLKWFTTEADRRGIWTVFEFFNIHVSPNFAKVHANEGVHVQNHASTPLLADYTRTCIRDFVSTYPNVGLMITAGEALNVEREKFVRDVIIPGVQDTGKTPPIIVREWTIDRNRYRDIVRPAYANLFTMMKHNVEMIDSAWPDPRNQNWSALGPHIINMHENSDVKPFRWGSPVFIQQMVTNWKAIGVEGMHIYPMTSWMWPESLDKTPMLTIDRDRLWLEAFGRYGWNPNRPAQEEESYWKSELTTKFGSATAGAAIYNFFIETGPILPGIQNTVNIYNMNYHPTAVGQEATLNGILHSSRWEGAGSWMARPLDALTLARYEKEFGKLSPEAENRPPLSVKGSLTDQPPAPDPVKLSQLFVEMAEDALAQLHSAQKLAIANTDEYVRFENDANCILALARFYHFKIQAAVAKGQFDQHAQSDSYDRMLALLDQSVASYRDLSDTATASYRQATDLSDLYRWDTTLQNFEAEDAFYHAQQKIATSGADVIYLGLDGPMNDATNLFHWTLEHTLADRHLTSQSYDLGTDPFRRAKLVVVYDTASPIFRRYVQRLEAYVRAGGKVLFWDSEARASATPLLDGVEFTTYTPYHQPSELLIGLAPDSDESASAPFVPLIASIENSPVVPTPANSLFANLASVSTDWHVLAWNGLRSDADDQFYKPGNTYGERWTSLMGMVLAPALVTRSLGKGQVILAQLGDAHIALVGPNPKSEVPSYLRTFIENLCRPLAQNE
jgi:hypothetical protein